MFCVPTEEAQYVFCIGHIAVIVAAKNDDSPHGENADPGENEGGPRDGLFTVSLLA